MFMLLVRMSENKSLSFSNSERHTLQYRLYVKWSDK